MKKLSRNQWIAVTLSLIVIIIFFTTGRNVVSFFGAGNEDRGSTQSMQTAQTIDAINDSTNDTTINSMDTAPQNSFSSSVSGFEIQDVVVGTGAEAVAGKTLTVHYSGAFTDGKVFDSSIARGVPFEFVLGAGMVIPGWDKGFDGMKVGGKRRLVVPPAFGYGASGAGDVIPPNATLVFEVELLGVK